MVQVSPSLIVDSQKQRIVNTLQFAFKYHKFLKIASAASDLYRALSIRMQDWRTAETPRG